MSASDKLGALTFEVVNPERGPGPRGGGGPRLQTFAVRDVVESIHRELEGHFYVLRMRRGECEGYLKPVEAMLKARGYIVTRRGSEAVLRVFMPDPIPADSGLPPV